MISLKQPMTAKQLSIITGFREYCCSYVLQELLRARIIVCLNPHATRSRLYWFTEDGRQYQNRILKMQGLPALKFDFPIVNWKFYGWICYSHRAEIIKALTEPMQPSSIRRKIIKQNPVMRISANNVTDILRLFLKKKIIKPVKIGKQAHLRYELTLLGKQLQGISLNLLKFKNAD